MNKPWFESIESGPVARLATALYPDLVIVLGASALQYHRPDRARTTLDVDLVAHTTAHLSKIPPDWTPTEVPHRFLSEDQLPIDIVPASPDELNRGYVEWKDGTRMSLLGIDLVIRDAERISKKTPPNLRVASVTGISVCKVVAYCERPGERRKDLGDLAWILEAYVEPDESRFYDDPALYERSKGEVESENRTAFLTGVDLRVRGDRAHREVVAGFARSVLTECSRLRSIFLAEARSTGHWTEDLIDSRFQALLDGIGA